MNLNSKQKHTKKVKHSAIQSQIVNLHKFKKYMQIFTFKLYFIILLILKVTFGLPVGFALE